jgi:hypothetical protein
LSTVNISVISWQSIIFSGNHWPAVSNWLNFIMYVYVNPTTMQSLPLHSSPSHKRIVLLKHLFYNCKVEANVRKACPQDQVREGRKVEGTKQETRIQHWTYRYVLKNRNGFVLFNFVKWQCSNFNFPKILLKVLLTRTTLNPNFHKFLPINYMYMYIQ